jgi:murein DD-endopeptidase MepM/ murein hydrolase activator NlpD
MCRNVLFIYFIIPGLLLSSGCVSPRVSTLEVSTNSPHKKTTGKNSYYLVKKGDSLWRISKQLGIPIATLKDRNQITDPGQLKAGQLLLIPKQDKLAKKESLFLFPVKGKITNYFGEVIQNRINKGLKIKVSKRADVHCAMSGEIVFKGPIQGYGDTVIIEHNNNLSTIYSYLSEIIIQKGDQIDRGQKIGQVAVHPQLNEYLLHFEIRRGHKATDPLKYVRYYEG